MAATITTWANNPTGYLTCEGIELLGPAWGIFEDLTPMLFPASLRGGSTLIPDQQGQVPAPQQIDDATWKFKLPVAGDVDQAGDPYTNPVAGLVSNLFTLAPIFEPVSVLDNELGTRTVTYHLPDYGDFTAEAQLSLDTSAPMVIGSDLQYGSRGALKRCVVTIYLPHGLFVPVP